MIANHRLYEKIIQELISLASENSHCRGLYQIGTVTHVGLSDIDVIYTYDDTPFDGKLIESKIDEVRSRYPLIPIDAFHTSKNSLHDFIMTFYVANINILWGSNEVPQFSFNKNELIILLLLQAPIKLGRIKNLLEFPDSDRKTLLLLISSLRHTLDIALSSFAGDNEKISQFVTEVEALRDTFISSGDVSFSCLREVFQLFESVWNLLMIDLRNYLRMNLKIIPEINKPVYHPVGGSVICIFKDRDEFGFECKRTALDNYFVSRFRDVIFGYSKVYLPVETLIIILSFKMQSGYFGENLRFFPSLEIKNYFPGTEVNKITAKSSLAAGRIYDFYLRNKFTKGFPLAHYFDKGLTKKAKKIGGIIKSSLTS